MTGHHHPHPTALPKQVTAAAPHAHEHEHGHTHAHGPAIAATGVSASRRLALIAGIVAIAGVVGLLGILLAPGLTTGLWNFVLDGQREMTDGMTQALKQLKALGSLNAALVLGLISFIYGVLHAVGPGHGKFVISSYALANEKTVRRGILLSFMAALIQALSAIVLVGFLALVFKATSMQRLTAEAWLETISWGLIAGLGAWLLWSQLGQPQQGHDNLHQDHSHAHAHSDHQHGPACSHTDEPGHTHDAHCGHTHMATPDQLQGTWRWSHAWSLAFSIGIRPCTGAIGVLLLSLSLGILWAGVFATFTMAIGTALTVSALAALAVGSRELAARIAGSTDSRWATMIQRGAAVGGSALVMIIGLVFFIASLRGAPPL
jgi:nickel/cobalt transporter (NicO) family protein